MSDKVLTNTTNEKGVLINGSIEEYTSYILQVVKKFPHHPRYFALGKIDIGNVSLSDQKKLLRGTATCTITLWDLDHGIIPVKIATTPVCRAEATAPNGREAQKKAAEKAASITGEEILRRIRYSMLEESDNVNNTQNNFDLKQLLLEGNIEVSEEW